MSTKSCSCCKRSFGPQDTRCDSGIFGASDAIELCATCSVNEDMLIEEAGTNNLPEVLKGYTKNSESEKE